MSLADDIAAALPEMRAQAESLMRDTCVASGPGGEPAWDDDSGTYTVPAGAQVYSGRCRLRMANPTGARSDSGEASWAVDDAILSLPIAGSEGVLPGSTVVVALGNDPAATVALTVQAGHFQTFSTARRLPCKVVARDA